MECMILFILIRWNAGLGHTDVGPNRFCINSENGMMQNYGYIKGPIPTEINPLKSTKILSTK